jgi:UDP:flavonoid glycosyltransferase YjiC (YdhE family)
MKFVLAGYGSRGDVEPFAAVGKELLRRGHDVCIAVAPNMLGFVESAGLAGVAFGPDSSRLLDEENVRNTKMRNPISVMVEGMDHLARLWAEWRTTLTALADGADLVLTGLPEQRFAANVAEYRGIPLALLDFFPNQHWDPGALGRLIEQMAKETEVAQRRELGLSEATGASTSLQIQAYDELCFPGLAAESAQHGELRPCRPFVGALTLELPTDADDEVLSWIAAGTAPIYFGFGSAMRVETDVTVATISAACAQLGERALICSGLSDFSHIPDSDHVKIVREVKHAAVFPACRAVVHHGGAGTTAAGMRAGIPTLILWLPVADQPIWAAVVERLKVGFGRDFSTTTSESLIADLRMILAPEYAARARKVATQMTKPAESVASAADLLEETARRGRTQQTSCTA